MQRVRNACVHSMRFEFIVVWLHLLQRDNEPYTFLFISEQARFVLLGPSLLSILVESPNGFLALLYRDVLVD